MTNAKYNTHNRAPFFELARPYIKEDSKVLDIGPGEGGFSDHFSRKDFYLFEGNPVTVALLKQSNANVFEGYLPKLPFDSDFFDVIHCSHVIEHLTHDIVFETLKEMDRCLKPGGYLVVSTPLMWSNFYNDLSHVKPYNPNIFSKYLCGTHIRSLTREAISDQYSVKKLQYRYRETDFMPFLENSKRNILVGAYLFGIKVLRRLGLKAYERTGYTIVLSKGGDRISD